MPDLAKVRDEFEALKRRVQDAGDVDSIQQLAELERRASDPVYWENAPTVVEQLSDHLKRLGIR